MECNDCPSKGETCCKVDDSFNCETNLLGNPESMVAESFELASPESVVAESFQFEEPISLRVQRLEASIDELWSIIDQITAKHAL